MSDQTDPGADEADALYIVLGRRVLALRTELGLTQDRVARACGLTRSSIANLEAGRQRIPLHTAAAIAATFGVPLADLVSGTEETLDVQLVIPAVLREQIAEVKRLRRVVAAVQAAVAGVSSEQECDR